MKVYMRRVSGCYTYSGCMFTRRVFISDASDEHAVADSAILLKLTEVAVKFEGPHRILSVDCMQPP